MQITSANNNLSNFYATVRETAATQDTSSSSQTSSSSSDTSSSSTASTSQTLDQNDFLTLLIKQMTNQDPLNPQSDTEFASQMAQFTALEQTKTLVSKMSTMTNNQSFQQASSLIGKTVKVTTDDSSTVSGVVSGVTVKDGTAQIVIDGTSYDLSNITEVSNTSSDSANTNNSSN